MDNQAIAEQLLYSKLADDLIFLGNNAILKMNVILYHERKNNVREYFYRETQYIDKNGHLARKINRKIDAFLSIENLKPYNGVKYSAIIRAPDMELMRLTLLPKFEIIVKHFSEVFQMRDGKLYLNTPIKPIEVGLVSKSTMWFKLGVHKLYNDELTPCMELYINNPNNVSIMSFSDVYGFMNIMRGFQIQQYAGMMVASFFQPPMGLNMFDMTIGQELTPITSYKYEEPEPLRLKREGSKGFFTTELNRRKDESNGYT